jgi:hypothetical protein
VRVILFDRLAGVLAQRTSHIYLFVTAMTLLASLGMFLTLGSVRAPVWRPLLFPLVLLGIPGGFGIGVMFPLVWRTTHGGPFWEMLLVSRPFNFLFYLAFGFLCRAIVKRTRKGSVAGLSRRPS